jgi:mannosyltransferase
VAQVARGRRDATGAPPVLIPATASRARAWWRRSRPEVAIALAGAATFSWHVSVPSPWWDEAITRDVVARPAADILALATHIDLVHLAYYLLVHALVGAGAGVTAIRMVSVIASALTAALLVRIGREFDQRAVGVCAGVLYVVAPLASRYAQEARPYALVTTAATAATLALLRALRRPWQPALWLAYAGLLVATGVLNLLAFTIVLAHLAYVRISAPRPVRRSWWWATLGAGAALTPLAMGAAMQRNQVSWLPRPDFDGLTGFLSAQYAPVFAVLLLTAVAIAGLRRRGAQPGTHREAFLLGVFWALLPPAALWALSQAVPLFDWRYVVFCLPGTALAMASLATLLRPLATAATVVALAVGGLHMQQVYRLPATGHAEDVRGAATVIGELSRPGDAVLFLPSSRRISALAYPEDFRNTDDVALKVDPTTSATLWGVEKNPAQTAAALLDNYRVWVVTGPARLGESATNPERDKLRLLSDGYRLVLRSEGVRYEVLLYVRQAPDVQ